MSDALVEENRGGAGHRLKKHSEKVPASTLSFVYLNSSFTLLTF